MVERGEDVLRADRIVPDECPVPIRSAANPATRHSTAPEQIAVDDGPVFPPCTARGVAQPWRPAMLRETENKGFVQKAAFFEINEYRAKGPVEAGKQFVAEAFEVAKMRVPGGVGDGDLVPDDGDHRGP